MTHTLLVEPYDPIIARDGRPFGQAAGNRMKTVRWPYPSVLAGSLRTLLGKRAGGNFAKLIPALKAIEVHGPLPCKDDALFVPVPKDLVYHEKKCYGARPQVFKDGEGWDLKQASMEPALLPDTDDDEFKPEQLPAFWSMKEAVRWLSYIPRTGFDLCKKELLDGPVLDERTHVQIDPASSAAKDGMLFSTAGIEFPLGLQMTARVRVNGELGTHLSTLDELHSLGGERRMARFRAQPESGWDCPQELAGTLSVAKRIRMQLVTPAIFTGGWMPDWVSRGEPVPGSSVKLRLKSACLERWRPVSGWSYESGGPKKVRRMVPAGGVYFFEYQDGNCADLAEKLWLAPVSDEEQDRRDGFGLAIWGIW